MKQIFTLLFTFLLSAMIAQVSIAPGSLATTISESGDHLYTLSINNAGTTPVTVWWKVKKGSTFPTQWSTQTCDLFTCYPNNFDECPGSKSQTIAAGTTVTYTMHFYPNGVSGSSTMSFELYSDKSFKTLIAQTDPTSVVVADKALSTKTPTSSDLKVFPNPADDYFVIKNDVGVSKVTIFNIVGKEVDSYKHISGATYNVSDYVRGLYIVRLIDSRGKTLKSIRLNKR
jgi:Secretion system C-terminal sorting domain